MDISKENLEQVLTTFANRICERYGIHFPNGGFVLSLEEDMANDVVMHAGNPVRIRVHWRVLAYAMEHNKLGDFRQTLQNCLEVASSKMLYTLSASPVAPVIAKDKTDKRWTKYKNTKTLLPFLLPMRRVDYEIHIVVRARDKGTGKCVTFSGDVEAGATVESLKTIAHRTLSKEVLNGRTGTTETTGGTTSNTPETDAGNDGQDEATAGGTASKDSSGEEEA